MITFNIIDAPDQQFGAILGDRRCTLRLRYNEMLDRWAFDLAIDDEPVLLGRRIVCGVDLLAAFAFGVGAVFAVSNDEATAAPGRLSFVDGSVMLYHATDAELAELRAA